MRNLEENINQIVIKKFNDEIDQKIKEASQKKGFNLDEFSKEELKKRCTVEMYEGISKLQIDDIDICVWGFPGVDNINYNGSNKIEFEYKFEVL